MANLLALDVGTKCIGVAAADTIVPIALPLTAINVDGNEVQSILSLAREKNVQTIVVGYPRNQSGDATEQTALVEQFANQLKPEVTVVYQDESLTSVMAEERLKANGKPYQKADIDAMAAAIILQDYLETHHVA